MSVRLALVVALPLLGCGIGDPCSAVLAARASGLVRHDSTDPNLEIARHVPGFGGIYGDGAGGAYTWLLEPTQQNADAVEAEWARITGNPNPFVAIRPLQGAYDWLQLDEVATRLNATPAPQGWTMSDIDEMRNRVVIGISPGDSCSGSGDLAEFEEWVSRAGVDREAVILEEFAPIYAAKAQ